MKQKWDIATETLTFFVGIGVGFFVAAIVILATMKDGYTVGVIDATTGNARAFRIEHPDGTIVWKVEKGKAQP